MTTASMPVREFRTPQELAAVLGVNPKTVLRYIESGEITATRIGRRWRIPQAEYDRLTLAGR